MKKILTVSTDQHLLNQLDDKLFILGFKVESVTVLDEVFERVKAFKPDVLIIDFILDYDNAAAISHKIKSDKETQYIPIIILSDLGGMQKVGTKLGSFSVITKPVSVDDVMETIFAALEENLYAV